MSVQLADDLARLLAAEPDGLSCDELARRLHRRRASVLAALHGDSRFRARRRGLRLLLESPGTDSGRTRTEGSG